jgi:multicomponent Na+:H+ antiporter subunit G
MKVLVLLFLILGSLFCLLTSLAVLRFPDFYTRLQALTKASTLGVGLVALAVVFYFGELSVSSRALLILLFLFVTNPVGGHMLGRAAYIVGVPLWKGTSVDELEGRYDMRTHKLKGKKPL